MKWRSRPALWLAVVLSGSLALAQPPQRPGGRPGMHPRGPGRPGLEGQVGPRNRAHHNMIDHLMSLPPEQQKEFMRTNPRFQNLPPRQQENIQRRLEQFNSLPPERREALRERFDLFRQLSPEQQEHARALYGQWRQYPPERRRELMREFRQLLDASPEERRQRMEGDEFRNRFSDQERETIQGLVDLLPAPEN